MTYPVAGLSHMPEVEKMLKIPENHYYCIIGFGYPETAYARGVQREGISKINELKF